MNKCNEAFIRRLNIDFSEFDSRVYTTKDINPIVAEYEVQGEGEIKSVPLEFMYGVDKQVDIVPDYTFPKILDSYFDAEGDGYHSRSVGMLQYDENNVIDKLQGSFSSEPMVLHEVDMDKYVVSTNGMHRFLVMRLLYLSARSKCKNETELNELIKKYTIPVKSKKIDLLKTYCKYLINLFQPADCMNEYYDNVEELKNSDGTVQYRLTKILGWRRSEIIDVSEEEMQRYYQSYRYLDAEDDDNFRLTGNSVLKAFNGKIEILTDVELIEKVKKIIKNSDRKSEQLFETLREQAQRYESFNLFLQTYFSDVINLGETEVRESGPYKRH